ncbi:predicted protein [Botrytis cinerea T4]|uniref:Uncharacterized protein n=1 Tax=Botryotinia fuckeliana (strain T4) TaxID=999810 RepID=G2YSE5_BOTF4|nr:predicted protein [Botrytis cinerea T4]
MSEAYDISGICKSTFRIRLILSSEWPASQSLAVRVWPISRERDTSNNSL